MLKITLPATINPPRLRNWCSLCKEEKDSSLLIKDKRWESYKCKECNGKKCNEYRKNNKDKLKKHQARYYELNKEKVRSRVKEYSIKNKDRLLAAKKKHYAENKDLYKDRELKRHFGISLEQYKEMSRNQHNVCKICGLVQKLVVDHCHTTGRVRGLLCTNCNTGIGLFKDNKGILKRAIKYLNIV